MPLFTSQEEEMTKKSEILVPIGGSVQRFGLEFKAVPSDPAAPKKGRGKRRPCSVEVVMNGKTFVLEAAHDGRNSSKYEQFGAVSLRYEGTAHVNGVGQESQTVQRVAVIKIRELPVEDNTQPTRKKKQRTCNERMERRLAEWSAQIDE